MSIDEGALSQRKYIIKSTEAVARRLWGVSRECSNLLKTLSLNEGYFVETPLREAMEQSFALQFMLFEAVGRLKNEE